MADTPPGYPARKLDAKQARADLTFLRRALVEVHPGFGRYTSAEASLAMLDHLAEKTSAGVTDVELYRQISLALARLRCDHTKAELPPSMAAFRKKTRSFLPFTFRIFAGRMYVSDPADGVVLKRADEILSINGIPVGDVLENVSRYLSVDGWTDHVKRVELENAGGELLAGAVDHFWPILYGWPDKWKFEFRVRTSGEVKRAEFDPIGLEQWNALAARSFAGAANFKDAVSFRILDEKSALLKVDTFVNYRVPCDPLAKFTPFFQELHDKRIEHLILDLRICGGGSDDAPEALLAFLMPAPLPPSKPAWVRTYRVGDLRPHLRTWDESVFEMPDSMFRKLNNGFYEIIREEPAKAREPEPLAFKGRLTVLIGPGNQSGATILLANLRTHRPNTRLIGEPTGGSAEGPTAGIMFFLKLPSSEITVRIPAIRSRLGLPFEPGMGVSPDLFVRESFDDWIAGWDAALEAARMR